MNVVIIYVLVAMALFLSAYITKRRFGLLGLALATGSILSGIWAYDGNLIAEMIGLKSGPLTSATVSAAIVLLPPVVLLFHGYSYKSLVGRLVGAGLFTLLALAFLVEPLSHILVLSGASADIYSYLERNRSLIIGVGLIIAVIDLFFTKPASVSEKKHDH